MHSTLNTKLNNLEKKTPDIFTLTQTNQCNTDKPNLEKNGDFENKIPDISGWVTTYVLNTKTGKVV